MAALSHKIAPLPHTKSGLDVSTLLRQCVAFGHSPPRYLQPLLLFVLCRRKLGNRTHMVLPTLETPRNMMSQDNLVSGRTSIRALSQDQSSRAHFHKAVTTLAGVTCSATRPHFITPAQGLSGAPIITGCTRVVPPDT